MVRYTQHPGGQDNRVQPGWWDVEGDGVDADRLRVDVGVVDRTAQAAVVRECRAGVLAGIVGVVIDDVFLRQGTGAQRLLRRQVQDPEAQDDESERQDDTFMHQRPLPGETEDCQGAEAQRVASSASRRSPAKDHRTSRFVNVAHSTPVGAHVH